MILGSETQRINTLQRRKGEITFEEEHHGLNVIQMELMEEMSRGAENDEIADNMHTSVSWVVNNKAQVKKMLRARNMTHLIAICYQKGILRVEPK
jgi:DNA-binding CsgD family transcriptional regulator